MIKLFSTKQMKEIDAFTIENEPIDGIDLVERAATAFVHEFIRRFSRNQHVHVFAGQGNNGADALAIARLLADESYKVNLYLFNPFGQLSQECEENKRRVEGYQEIDFQEVKGKFVPPVLKKWDVIIDGLFGSGLNRPLEGGFAAVVNRINQSEAMVVAIDIPSGLFGEDNSTNNKDAIIKADVTFTFGSPKLAFLLPENATFIGEWKVLDIGLSPEAIESTPTNWCLLEKEDLAPLIKVRNRFSHKGTYGHALLIAGSRGKIGASVLAARSCLRSGAGLLTVHIPQRAEVIFQTAFPEAMLSFDVHMDRFTCVPDLLNYTTLAIGPGLGSSMETIHAFEKLLEQVDKPIVIDADAINILSANKELIKKIPAHSILTPHPKEFDRLVGEECKGNGYLRLQKAINYAKQHTLYVVLKGAHTAICTPEGEAYINNSGNTGMATAGSGDVLTGILLALLTQGYNPKDASFLGVYLHGLAGDLAMAYYSEESMIAGDITEMLGKAFQQIKQIE